MNTANLQLEGLLMAVAALHRTLVAQGVLSRDQVAATLTAAEEALRDRVGGETELSEANRDAVLFPIRLLSAANSSGVGQDLPHFQDLAREIARMTRTHQR